MDTSVFKVDRVSLWSSEESCLRVSSVASRGLDSKAPDENAVRPPSPSKVQSILDRLRALRWCEEPTRCSSVAKPRLPELLYSRR